MIGFLSHRPGFVDTSPVPVKHHVAVSIILTHRPVKVKVVTGVVSLNIGQSAFIFRIILCRNDADCHAVCHTQLMRIHDTAVLISHDIVIMVVCTGINSSIRTGIKRLVPAIVFTARF